jgi:predicted helicase
MRTDSPLTISQYLKTIQDELAAGNATEHTHRSALKSLIESLAEKVTATNEPQRIKCGAPDYIVTRGHVPLGYVEAKDVDISLDAAEKTAQLKRYRESLGNLILTDYLEFRWYVRPRPSRTNECPESEHRLTARLASVGKNGKLRVEEEGAANVLELLNAFLNAQVPTVQSAKELAVRMAKLAQLIRDTIQKALAVEEETGTLHQQMSGFREVLLHDLTEEEFADMYAQTICYGLFAARCNAKGSEHFTREHAAYDLPKTNPFLRKMFSHIAGPELDERIAWAVDDLAELLHHANISAILQDFGKRTRREDPVVHFYETFLAAYDSKMREARGVYYTPEPVVSYIVASIDQILKTDFKLPDGLADSSKILIRSPGGKGKTEIHRVLILDPATGTGTFLYGVVNHIFESFKKNLGMWSGYVTEHLLPRLFGFELLMAPYAVAHMKLGLQLDETGYDFKADERLGVYLTNTLEEAHEVSKLPLFTQWLAEEANAASKIKQEKPVMVITGNPPYSVSSQNKGDWISKLIQDYKKDLNEKKLNLDDDFIKFFKFGQWRIEQTGYGILAFISNNTYLDGLTHRRMRESLMQTFDDIYILDLHGSSMRKERSPDGSKDENVFDIQQGVAIGLFVRRNKRSRRHIYHAEIWGTRENKYNWLLSKDIASTKWVELTPGQPNFFFIPRDETDSSEYESYLDLRTVFRIFGNGIGTDRDSLFYDDNSGALANRLREFYSPMGTQPPFSDRYRVEDSSSYPLLSRRAVTSFDPSKIVRCLYRPFDWKWIYYDEKLTSRPAREVMRNLLQENLALLVTRQVSTRIFQHVFVSNELTDRDPLSLATRERTQVFPLYLFPTNRTADLPSVNRSAGVANLTTTFVAYVTARLTLEFVPEGSGNKTSTLGPEDVFDYMYAVFHSPTYRSRYAEFLKIDFPRLPLTSSVELFRGLCRLGSLLVDLHLMERVVAPNMTRYPVAGDNEVEKVQYTQPGEAGSEEGRVWINREQYFEGVPPEVWNFQVGGYQVCQKWLKDRKGRKLTYDDLTHYQHIVSALNETLSLMSQIDAVIEEHGGWPIK